MNGPALELRLSLRLFFGGEKCFGPGPAALLEATDRLGSLRAAAAEADMAYSKAWRIIRTAEGVFGCKLLLSTVGGSHGGGAKLTPEAQQLLAAYQSYVSEVHAFAQERFQVHFDGLPDVSPPL